MYVPVSELRVIFAELEPASSVEFLHISHNQYCSLSMWDFKRGTGCGESGWHSALCGDQCVL